MYINILGYGITNKALVTLLNKNGIICKIYDSQFQENRIDEIGNEFHPFHTLKNNKTDSNLTIISPGIPPHAKFLNHFSYIISEYDFIYSFLKNFYSIWISGTNGKTTTTEMASLLLNLKSGGNIGTPLAELFLQDCPHTNITKESLQTILEQKMQEKNTQNRNPYQITQWEDSNTKWILETSSFTLHYTQFALPNLYILLPLSQDHINWHGNYENYVLDKLKPITLMNETKDPKKHFALLPKDLLQSQTTHEMLTNAKANIYFYKDSEDLFKFLQCEDSYFTLFKEPFKLDFLLAASAMKFSNIPYNLNNITQYQIGAHRLEEEKYKGMLFINDSKATNPHATLAAIKSYKNYDLYLILGGDAKGADLSLLYPFLHEYRIKVFSIGKDGATIYKECLENKIWAKECQTLQNALQTIHTQLKDFLDSNQESTQEKNLPAIMLSPACASLDQYASYKIRGKEFKKLIKEIF